MAKIFIASIFSFLYVLNVTAQRVDSLVIYKSKRLLLVYSKNKIIKRYKVALGSHPKGKKHFEGDGKTPEGKYYINNKNPYSSYHLNLGISYPNQQDRLYAQNHKKPAGGAIKIHGLPNKFSYLGKLQRLYDWTQGCIALSNSEIEELYKIIPVGTIIYIYP